MAEPVLRDAAVIGRGIEIQGEVSGAGDLVVEGRVRGRITLARHLIVEAGGVVEADVTAARITVLGEARGQLTATERVEVKATAKLAGDIHAPSVIIEDGAGFQGSIHMDVALPEAI
jgi:cytoskeletal protein CcmA (bactofilin family)